MVILAFINQCSKSNQSKEEEKKLDEQQFVEIDIVRIGAAMHYTRTYKCNSFAINLHATNWSVFFSQFYHNVFSVRDENKLL